jgi:hypothetical protein
VVHYYLQCQISLVEPYFGSDTIFNRHLSNINFQLLTITDEDYEVSFRKYCIVTNCRHLKRQTIVNIHAILLYIFQAMTQISIGFCYFHSLVFLELEGHEGVIQFVVGHYWLNCLSVLYDVYEIHISVSIRILFGKMKGNCLHSGSRVLPRFCGVRVTQYVSSVCSTL